MPQASDKLVRVVVAGVTNSLNRNGFTEEDLKKADGIIQELASDPSPMNRYRIAEVTSFAVTEVLSNKEDFLDKLSEQKNVALGEKAQFAVGQNDVAAYIQAKGGTPLRSKIANKYLVVDTVEVAARPYVNFQDLATGRVKFSTLVESAAREMLYKKIQYIQSILHTALKGAGAGAYASANGLNDTAFNKVLINFRRQSQGKTRIVGDVFMLDQLNGISGFNGKNAPSDIAQEEIRHNGFIGAYKGCDVFAFDNPPIDSDFNTLLNPKLLYMFSGDISPLKVVNEGSVRTMEQQNIDDESFEMVLRQNFGAAFVVGRYPNLGAFEDTTA